MQNLCVLHIFDSYNIRKALFDKKQGLFAEMMLIVNMGFEDFHVSRVSQGLCLLTLTPISQKKFG